MPRLRRYYYLPVRTRHGAQVLLVQALKEDPTAQLELRRAAQGQGWIGQLTTDGPLSGFHGPLGPATKPGTWGRVVRRPRA